jgi:hypothetical protein
MCERAKVRERSAVGFGVLACAVVLAASPHRALAFQQLDDNRAAQRARLEASIDSLSRELGDARLRAMAAQDAYDRRTPAIVAGLDTLHVGPLTVLAPEAGSERARAYFASAWAHYEPLVGGEIPGDFRERTFVYQDGWVVKPIDVARQGKWVTARPWMSSAAKEALVRTAVGDALEATLSGPQIYWAGATLLTSIPDLEAVYRHLATGLSASLRRCKAGDLEACWLGMGATDVTGLELPDGREVLHQHMEAWYTESQRRSVAVSLARTSRARDRCAAALAGCEETLLENYEALAPLGREARSSLVGIALEMGGPGSFARFRAPLAFPPDYRQLISRTAGVDADLVMAEWHRRVIAAKPDRPRADREARVGSVLWILLFTALAARSTRWRLG